MRVCGGPPPRRCRCSCSRCSPPPGPPRPPRRRPPGARARRSCARSAPARTGARRRGPGACASGPRGPGRRPRPRRLPGGDTLITSYALHRGASLASLGLPFGVDVLDGTFRAIAPDGWPTYYWSASGRIAPVESLRWAGAWNAYPGLAEPVWDWHPSTRSNRTATASWSPCATRTRSTASGAATAASTGSSAARTRRRASRSWATGSRAATSAASTTSAASPTGRSPCSTTARVFTYRAVPVLPGELSRTALLAGMDAMHPRP